MSTVDVSAVAEGSPSISCVLLKNDTEPRIQGRFISEYDRCRVPITSISDDSHDGKPVASKSLTGTRFLLCVRPCVDAKVLQHDDL